MKFCAIVLCTCTGTWSSCTCTCTWWHSTCYKTGNEWAGTVCLRDEQSQLSRRRSQQQRCSVVADSSISCSCETDIVFSTNRQSDFVDTRNERHSVARRMYNAIRLRHFCLSVCLFVCLYVANVCRTPSYSVIRELCQSHVLCVTPFIVYKAKLQSSDIKWRSEIKFQMDHLNANITKSSASADKPARHV